MLQRRLQIRRAAERRASKQLKVGIRDRYSISLSRWYINFIWKCSFSSKFLKLSLARSDTLRRQVWRRKFQPRIFSSASKLSGKFFLSKQLEKELQTTVKVWCSTHKSKPVDKLGDPWMHHEWSLVSASSLIFRCVHAVTKEFSKTAQQQNAKAKASAQWVALIAQRKANDDHRRWQAGACCRVHLRPLLSDGQAARFHWRL